MPSLCSISSREKTYHGEPANWLHRIENRRELRVSRSSLPNSSQNPGKIPQRFTKPSHTARTMNASGSAGSKET
jgi:hypothetical protein